jgi:hypothetical protein
MGLLQYVDTPYAETEKAAMLRDLRECGFCLLRDVYERSSVTAYERRIRQLAGPGARYDVHARPIAAEDAPQRWWLPNDVPEFVEPILAPRIRTFLPSALIPSDKPRSKIQVYETAWVVDPKTDAQHWVRATFVPRTPPSSVID